MQPIQPDQADFLLQGVYLPGLKNEQRITRTVIEAIPLDKGDYRPDEVSKSALDLAWHIVVHRDAIYGCRRGGGIRFQPQALPGFREDFEGSVQLGTQKTSSRDSKS